MEWEVSGPLPLDVSLAHASYSFLPPSSFFVGVENWIGLISINESFVITVPSQINVVGFAQLSDLPPITDIEAQADNLIYLTGGSQLTIVGASYPCYLVPIATAEFPFPTRDVQLAGDRIYVGGYADEQLHIAVLDRRALPNIVRLGALTLAPAVWSVVGEQLLTYDLASATISVSDVSDLGAPASHRTLLALDPDWEVMAGPQFVADNLSLVVLDKGLGSFTNLLGPQPERSWRPLPTYYDLTGHMAQEEYLFLAHNFCDLGCASWVSIATRAEGPTLQDYSLYPHTPVFYYHAVRENVIFAFSDYSLIVMNLDAPPNLTIVRTYPLRGRLDQ